MSDLHVSPTLRRILLEALILTSVAFAIGLSINYQLVMNAFTSKHIVVPGPAQKPAATPSPQLQVEHYPNPIELNEIDAFLAEGALLVDARNRDAYLAGHLAGAVSLPLGKFAEQREEFTAQVPRQRPLILYCSGFGCPDSFDLGVQLLAAGYKDVYVYEGGFPEWRDQGRPVMRGEHE